ncbi:MAG: toprim domain-containing protein [Streptosporangiaceae bacterium]
MPVSGEDWADWLRAAAGPPIAHEAAPRPWTALTWLARRRGFTVKRQASGPTKSQTIWNSRRIEVHGDLKERDAAQALLHELAHVLLDADAVHPPGASTAGCRGIQKLTADSVAFIVTVRLGLDGSKFVWPYVSGWAGSDPRARPDDSIRTARRRVTEAAAAINRHLDITLLGIPPQPAATATPQSETASPAFGHSPPDDVSRILVAAEHFYLGHLHRSWAPRYLASRGLNQAAVTRWRIGYAPTGWTTLTDHLRRLGHDDAAIQEAGLARRSSRGTLIDHFRDRVMLAIRDERGEIVGFIGRARPNADSRTPKYLNSPESATYKKGEVLFGLHEARSQLAHGAMPVVVEGPFDAIAVTAADPRQYAGLAPLGTAFTTRQAETLSRAVDLHQAGVLVALDGDRAGQQAAIKAHETLLPHTHTANAAILPPGRDPAEILQTDGPAALRAALQHTEPLAKVMIDAHIDQWAGQLDHAEGQLNAMRSAAAYIAGILPPETADAILSITGGQSLATLEDSLRPVANPELPAIARILPPDAIRQIVRTADRTRCDYSEVTAAVANTVAQDPQRPKDAAVRQVHQQRQVNRASPAPLASHSFPARPRSNAPMSGATTTDRRQNHRAPPTGVSFGESRPGRQQTPRVR